MNLRDGKANSWSLTVVSLLFGVGETNCSQGKINRKSQAKYYYFLSSLSLLVPGAVVVSDGGATLCVYDIDIHVGVLCVHILFSQ